LRTCERLNPLDVVPVEISLYEGAPSIGPLGTKGAGEVPILKLPTQSSTEPSSRVGPSDAMI